MKKNTKSVFKHVKELLFLSLFFSIATFSYAANPTAPFSPNDNVLDPGCLPTDSNCYVSLSNLTLTNATTSTLYTTLLRAVTLSLSGTSTSQNIWSGPGLGQLNLPYSDNISGNNVFTSKNTIPTGNHNAGLSAYNENTNNSTTVEAGQFVASGVSTANTGQSVIGITSEAYNNSTSSTGIIPTLSSINSYIENRGTSTEAYGLTTYGYNTGNLASAYGIYIFGTDNTGTLNNNYGLRVSNLTSGTNAYAIYTDQSATNTYAFYAAGAAKSYFGGNVGIGTTTPSAKLSISGVGSNGTLLSITSNGSAGNYTATNSGMFMYDAAGNEMLRIVAGDTNPGNYNSLNLFIGAESGKNQPSDNTSAGYQNVGVGYRTLYSNTTGADNSAFGISSLQSNTTGNDNAAYGWSTLYANTTGYENSALGSDALLFNTTGYRNTSLGTYSGFNPNSGSAQYNIASDTYMTLIGYGATKDNSSTLTNGIAIGSGAHVLQSNQAVLGNDSITSTLLKGNVSIGTTTNTVAKFVIENNDDTNGARITTTIPAGGGYDHGLDIILKGAPGFNDPGQVAGIYNTYNSVGTNDAIDTQDYISSGYYGDTSCSIGHACAGIWSLATASGVNGFVIGVAGDVTGSLSSNNRIIGVFGNASPTSTKYTGGYFSLGAPGYVAAPENAALIADNASSTSPIFLARDNGSTVFSIVDGGNVGIGTTTPNAMLSIDNTNNSIPSLAVTGTTWFRPFTSNPFSVVPGTNDQAALMSYSVINGGNWSGAGITESASAQLQINSIGTPSAKSAAFSVYLENTSGKNLNRESGILVDAGGFGTSTAIGSGIDIEQPWQLPLDYAALRIQDQGASQYAIKVEGGKSTFAGSVGIGTTTPQYLLHVGNTTIPGVVARFENSTGYCDINPTTTSLTCTSDERLKKNIVTLDASTTLNNLRNLRAVTYNWKTEGDASSAHAGFIAQEVKPLFPDLVAQDPTGTYSVSYGGFIPYIIQSIQAILTRMDGWRNQVSTKELCVDKSTGGQVCVTGDQLDSLLNSNQQVITVPVQIPVTSDSSSTESSATTTETADASTTTDTSTTTGNTQASTDTPATETAVDSSSTTATP